MHAQLYTNVYHAPMPLINTIYLLQTSSEIFRTETELYWKLTKKMFLKWTSKFLFYAVIVNKHSIVYPLSRNKKNGITATFMKTRHHQNSQLHWSNCSLRPLYVLKQWLWEILAHNRSLDCCRQYFTVPAEHTSPFLVRGIS